MTENKLLEVLKLKQQLIDLKQKESYRQSLIYEIDQMEKRKLEHRKIINDLGVKVNDKKKRICKRDYFLLLIV